MGNLPVNPDCTLSGTRYCRLLNMGRCETCFLRDAEERQNVAADLDVYETLLPAGGVAQLFTDESCRLCRHEPREPRAGFAILDMAHPEPKRVQKWLLGKRVARIGTMIPVQMGVCKQCRRTLLWIEYLPPLAGVAAGVCGLALFGVGALADWLKTASAIAPFLAWVALTGLGVLAGWLGARALGKRANERMYVDVLTQPVVAEMVQRGWTPITANKRTKVLFSKSRIARGLGTAEEPAPAEAPAIAEKTAQNGQNS